MVRFFKSLGLVVIIGHHSEIPLSKVIISGQGIVENFTDNLDFSKIIHIIPKFLTSSKKLIRTNIREGCVLINPSKKDQESL